DGHVTGVQTCALPIFGPGYWRTDASLFKRFSFSSGQAFEFRIEAVNVFNHVNLGNPDSEIGVPGNNNANAGRITSTAYGGVDPRSEERRVGKGRGRGG